MARDGIGNYTLPAGQPVVSGTVIDSSVFNTLTTDLSTALTASIARDGQSPPTANLPMGGYRHTGVGNGAVRTDYASLAQVQDGAAHWLTGVAGTDTITATLATPTLAAYVAGLVVRFVSAGANTTTTPTLNINILGAITLKRRNGDALVAGDLTGVVEAVYDGTDFLVIGLANIGYLNIPQNIQSGAAYTLVAADAGKHILHPSADTTARIWTIPANSSVAFQIGTAITFINQQSAGVITISITTDTMRLAGAGTTGSRTLAANGVATAVKITATEWIISGTGLT